MWGQRENSLSVIYTGLIADRHIEMNIYFRVIQVIQNINKIFKPVKLSLKVLFFILFYIIGKFVL